MKEIVVRQLIIEHIEKVHQKPYTAICLGRDFDLNFISKEKTEEKYRNRPTWIASFYLDLEKDEFIEFFPTLIEIFLDDETGEIWEPFNPYKKLTAQEKRAARKKRRQERRKSRKYY